jgi:AAA15 family ATPase/GTPase
MQIRRFWVRNFKSLRDVELGFPTKLTVVVGAQRPAYYNNRVCI